MRSLFFVSSLLLIAFIQSCTTTKPATYPEPAIGSATFDYWIHTPLHPKKEQSVQFKAEIEEAKKIAKVELYVYEYELYTNDEGLPSKRRRASSQWGLLKTWSYNEPLTNVTIAFDYLQGFQDFSNVEYVFKVHDIQGAITERLALFDAGQSPWGDEKILLYATTRNPLRESINLCFLPDTDYGRDWDGFLKDVEQLIYEGYHGNNKINANKDLWQFYYTEHEMDGKAVAEDYYDKTLYPDFMKNALIQGIDAFGLLHQLPYGDGAYLQRNLRFLAYNFFTSETYNHGTAVHETAHAIFNLSDEYDHCACFENPRGANVFANLEGCEAFNKKHGFPLEDCTAIRHLNGQDWYMSEPNVYFESKEACELYNKENGYKESSCERFIDVDEGDWYRSLDGLCIMQDDGDDIIRDFKRTCSSIIDNYYDKLRKQSNYLIANQEETQDNIFGYEPVVLMELQAEKVELSIEAKEIINGVPNKNFISREEALQVDFLNKEGQKKYSLSIANPNELMVHGGEHEEELIELEEVTYRFAIPYEKDTKSLKFKRKNGTEQKQVLKVEEKSAANKK